MEIPSNFRIFGFRERLGDADGAQVASVPLLANRVFSAQGTASAIRWPAERGIVPCCR
jgi:hypothetical protein